MSAEGKAAGRVLLPDTVVPTRYDLRLQPDLEKFVFDGHLKVTVEVHEATDVVSVHARELQIKSARFIAGSGGAAIDAVSYEQDLIHHVLKLSFDPMLPVGSGTLEFEYTGLLNDALAGFYRSPYEDIDGKKKMMASTQFESLDARRCFPCWDEPARKAVFAVTLVIHPSLIGFSNMPEKSSRLIEQQEGSSSKHMREIAFMDSPRMSTYLLAFVVGEFDFVQTLSERGVLIRVYTPPGRAHLGTFTMEFAKRCLDKYDDFFGLHYPLPKLDMVGIPEFSFGAMENWGLVTFREADMLIDPKTASNAQKQRVSIIIAHELAHQWFGNLVTMNWWDDLWLNEGFASWCMVFAGDLLMPTYQLWDQFLLDTTALALSLDGLKTSHPIQVPIGHAVEVQEVFDAISYFKGACVIHLAHEVLGHEAFQKGIKSYMRNHQYSNTETYDLWNAWENASGLPVAKMMCTWTEQMGYPVLDIEHYQESGGVAKLRVTQSWFLSSGELPPDDRTWCLPIFWKTSKEQKMVLMKDKTMEFDVPMPQAQEEADMYILLNAHMRVPMRVRYTQDMQHRLLKAVANGRLSDCRDRAMLVMDSEALALAGKIGVDYLLRLLASFSDESHYVVLRAIASTLGELRIAFMGGAPDHLYSNFMNFAHKLVTKVWNNLNLGFVESENDGHLTGLLRGLMVEMMSRYAVTSDFLEAITQRFNKYMEDPIANAAELPDEFRVPLLRMMLERGGNEVHTKLMSIVPKLRTSVEVKHVLLSIGASADLQLKEAALKWAISGQVKKQDFVFVFQSTAESSKDGLDLTWRFFQSEWASMMKFVKGTSPKIIDSLIKMSLSGHCSKEMADEVEKFFRTNPMPQNMRSISQTLESIRNRAEFLKRALQTNILTDHFWDELCNAI